MRSRFPWLVALMVITLCAVMLQAKRSMTAVLEVAPDPAHPGEALAVTTSLTNNTNVVAAVTVSVHMRGPCGEAASKTYKLLLNAHQSDTSKASFQAPNCIGGYQATLTVSDDRDSALLGETTKAFEIAKPVIATTGGKESK